MQSFIYIQIHMLEVRIKQLEKQATEKEAAKEAAEKEAAKKEVARMEAAEKETVENDAAEKEAAEKEDDDEEENQSYRPSGCRDDVSPVSLIRFSRVKHWFKCPIFFNHLYQHKYSLFFHIKYKMMDEFLTSTLVEQ
jgi:hypothetical protein